MFSPRAVVALFCERRAVEISGEEQFHASPLICYDRFVIHRSNELVRLEAKLLRLVGEVARRA